MTIRLFGLSSALLIGASLPVCGLAQLDAGCAGGVVCVGAVKSIDLNIAVPVVAKGTDKPFETIQCAILHVAVDGSLVGEVPSEISVLVSERVLSEWGYTVRPVPNSTAAASTVAKRAGGKGPLFYSGAPPIEVKDLHGFRGVFVLEEPNESGAFYLAYNGKFVDMCHDINPQMPPAKAARIPGVQYALVAFDNPSPGSLYATDTTAFDRSLPSGLRMLDFLASDLLSKDPFVPASLNWLRGWNPLDYRIMHEKSWISDLPVATIRAWFLKRFSDSKLTPAQRNNQDLLCLRADWGDQAAYPRFKASCMSTGKPSKWLWIPRQADPDLLLFLAERADTAFGVRAYFTRLAECPQAKSRTLALAGKLLGKSLFADQGILECLYKLTGNPALNPSDEHGMKMDISACREEARKLIQAGQGK